ncbi:hypothetical protein [Nonomuraea sp. NPDC005650]|uniref:hypothetical protein n=1 Tax=Nonomuraea sp. NPDC005650 TaxID=3157045 RepID=UPI0033AFC8A4
MEGFIRLAAIESTMERAINGDKPALFLITGVGNSGRTSLANHMLYAYQRAATARLAGYRFVVHRVERDDMTHDAYQLLRSTLLSLRNKMHTSNIEIPPRLQRGFTTLSHRAPTNPMNEYDLQEIAEFAATAFAAHDAGFGIRYEGVSTKELLTQAAKVFENTRTVVVFTIDNYDHASTVQLTDADRQAFARRGHVIDLSALTPRQIAVLADGRWTGEPPSPFDLDGVQRAFSTRPYTIGQAMQHLAVLLDCRLSEYDSDEPWPTDGLLMHEMWMQLKMWQAEKWNGLGDPHG